MENRTALRIAARARTLEAQRTLVHASGVSVCFDEFDTSGRTIGHACFDVTSDVIALSSYQHTSCARGVAWSRSVARKLHALDGLRERLVG